MWTNKTVGFGFFFPWFFVVLNCKSSRADPGIPEGDLGETVV